MISRWRKIDMTFPLQRGSAFKLVSEYHKNVILNEVLERNY